jgi:hypothetical protein
MVEERFCWENEMHGAKNNAKGARNFLIQLGFSDVKKMSAD